MIEMESTKQNQNCIKTRPSANFMLFVSRYTSSFGRLWKRLFLNCSTFYRVLYSFISLLKYFWRWLTAAEQFVYNESSRSTKCIVMPILFSQKEHSQHRAGSVSQFSGSKYQIWVAFVLLNREKFNYEVCCDLYVSFNPLLTTDFSTFL